MPVNAPVIAMGETLPRLMNPVKDWFDNSDGIRHFIAWILFLVSNWEWRFFHSLPTSAFEASDAVCLVL